MSRSVNKCDCEHISIWQYFLGYDVCRKCWIKANKNPNLKVVKGEVKK